MPKRKANRTVEIDQLRDVLARGSVASTTGSTFAAQAIRPDIEPVLLKFRDDELERDFIHKALYNPNMIRLLRQYTMGTGLLMFMYLIFDLQLEPRLRDPLVATRIPQVLVPLAFVLCSRRPWFERHLLRICTVGFVITSLALVASMYFLATIHVENNLELSPRELQINMLYGNVTIMLLIAALVVLCLRMPLVLVVPPMVPYLLVVNLVFGLLLDKVGPVHVSVAFFVFATSLALLIYTERKIEYTARKEFIAMVRVEEESRSTDAAKRLCTSLLLNVLPLPIATRLQAGESTIADTYVSVSVVFVSIVRISSAKGLLRGKELVRHLNGAFISLEPVCDAAGVEKVKTTGQLFMAVAGAPHEAANHVDAAVNFSAQAFSALTAYGKAKGVTLEVRMGADTGRVVAGVIGKTLVTWDLFGDTVNSASRMCSTAPLGVLQVTEACKGALKRTERVEIEDRGMMKIKGKGEVRTFLLHPSTLTQMPGELDDDRRDSGALSQTATDIESLVSGGTGAASLSSMTDEERLAQHVLTAPIDSHFKSSFLFTNADLEAEFQASLEAWISKNGMHGIKVQILVQLVSFSLSIAGAIGDDLGMAWFAVRTIGLLLLAFIIVKTRDGSGNKRHMVSSVWIACISTLASIVLVTSYMMFVPYLEVFLISFIVVGLSGLTLWVSLPPLVVTLLCVAAIFLSQTTASNLGLIFFNVVAVVFAVFTATALHRGLRRTFLQQKRVAVQHKLLRRQLERARGVLHRVMPVPVIERLQTVMARGGSDLGLLDDIPEATVVAMDVAGFTRLSAAAGTPTMVVLFVNALFDKLDELCEAHGLEKLKTIGDAYICASGVHRERAEGEESGVVAALRFAVEAIESVQTLTLAGESIRVRIGVGTGPLLGGLMGKTSKLCYDAFGECLEVAERMEQSAEPGTAQVCSLTARKMGQLDARDVMVDQVGDLTWRARWRVEEEDGPIEVPRTERVTIEVLST